MNKKNKNTPIYKQWLKIKKETEAILLFQVGDFYELFEEDAKLLGPVLNLTVTQRNKKNKSSMFMAGFPRHVVSHYSIQIIENGYKVAICDQVNNKLTKDKIVERRVKMILTAGMRLEEDGLDPCHSNYLVSIVKMENLYSIAVLEWSTAHFNVTIIKEKNKVINELKRINPSEVIIYQKDNIDVSDIVNIVQKKCLFRVEYIKQSNINDLLKINLVEELIKKPSAILSCNIILNYVMQTQSFNPSNILIPIYYKLDNFLMIDSSTLKSMGIIDISNKNNKEGMLVNLLIKYAQTNMGKRYLTNELIKPPISIDEIQKRQELVEFFVNNDEKRRMLINELKNIGDFERLIGKYTNKRFNYTDLFNLRDKISYSRKISFLFCNSKNTKINVIGNNFDSHDEIMEILENIIYDEMPDNNDIKLNNKSFLKKGYNNKLDKYLINIEKYNKEINLIEQKERKKSNLKSLTVKHDRQSEHYIQITRSQFLKVKKIFDYHIIQNTLTYVKIRTHELDKVSSVLFENKEKKRILESELLEIIGNQIVLYSNRLYKTARKIAYIDMMCAFAIISRENNYIKPIILSKEKRYLSVKQARHPVIETLIEHTADQFVPNNIHLAEESCTMIITGPNMGGKSTVMKQVAIIQVLAQSGCFVPAESAIISICDRIFARMGAGDDLLHGHSTFMVEVMEIANICKNATKSSLILFDEIGHGTNYHEGIAIAISLIEYLSLILCARIMCATHHHELSVLESAIHGIKNYCVDLEEVGDDIKFLYTLKKGVSRKNYGIKIAELGGIPKEVILKAKKIAKIL